MDRPPAFRCGRCGEPHEGPALDVAFHRPEAFLRVPEEERDRRCRSDDDFCMVDGRRFFLRGVLEIPIVDHARSGCLGVWVEVTPHDFGRYATLFRDPDQGREPPFHGHLGTEVPGYPRTEGLPVEVRLTTAEERPAVRLLAPRHPLAAEQAAGVPLAAWHRIHHRILHEA